MKRGLVIFTLLFLSNITLADDVVRVGSKKFTEGYIISEILAQMIEEKAGLRVERKFGLGGTVICFEALKEGGIDLYPEYSGTASEVLLKGQFHGGFEEMKRVFRTTFDLEWLEPFGFNNTYAIAVTRALARKRGIATISDLHDKKDLRFGLSHEFLNRRDGWPNLSETYGLAPTTVTGLDHGLAYEAMASGEVDVIDAYSTDSKIMLFDLTLLEDDRHFFPPYLAAPIVRQELLERHPKIRSVLQELSGRITEPKMQALNAALEIDKRELGEVAREFLVREGILQGTVSGNRRNLWGMVTRHLMLTFVSTGIVAIVGIPLGVAISRRRKLSRVVISIAGVAQTIPGIALLVFMIPLFGIGVMPALMALILYALLPILHNTCAGLRSIPTHILEAADGIGLTKLQRLIHVELPISLRFLFAGIRISAVTNIGTATLAAFIGAGGLGEPIVTGLAMNDTKLILSGAIPAAVLAIMTEIALELVEKWVTPRG